MKIIPNITHKSVIQHIEDIEERNEAFHALDNQSKRLEIAWEALQIALMPQVAPNECGYWSDTLIILARGQPTSKHFQKSLIDSIPDCQVCQRGLMMLAQIRIGNSIKPSDLNAENGNKHNIQGFTLDSFESMENAFESYPCKLESDYAYSVGYDCNSKELLANICCNVLVNGDFNYKDTTDYLIIQD